MKINANLYVLLGIIYFSFFESYHLKAQNNNEIVSQTTDSKLPDFTVYTDGQEKKIAFFLYLRPIVQKENELLLAERADIKQRFIDEKAWDKAIRSKDSLYLVNLAAKYRVNGNRLNEEIFYRNLYKKVDIIPVELALTQAAIESAWGTSFFAIKANNLFGQWCFTPGCGIVPRKRKKGATHEVAKYSTVKMSVRSYMKNLNSHPAYKKLRESRHASRLKSENPNAIEMAIGLEHYSGIGMKYVKEIRKMIIKNRPLMGLENSL